MNTEIVYLGHDNSIDLILKANDVAQDLSTVTKMTITVGSVLVQSTNQASDPILWAQGGYATGETRLFLGGEAISAGRYDAPLVVYDPGNPDGIVWGYVNLEVLVEVEAS